MSDSTRENQEKAADQSARALRLLAGAAQATGRLERYIRAIGRGDDALLGEDGPRVRLAAEAAALALRASTKAAVVLADLLPYGAPSLRLLDAAGTVYDAMAWNLWDRWLGAGTTGEAPLWVVRALLDEAQGLARRGDALVRLATPAARVECALAGLDRPGARLHAEPFAACLRELDAAARAAGYAPSWTLAEAAERVARSGPLMDGDGRAIGEALTELADAVSREGAGLAAQRSAWVRRKAAPGPQPDERVTLVVEEAVTTPAKKVRRR